MCCAGLKLTLDCTCQKPTNMPVSDTGISGPVKLSLCKVRPDPGGVTQNSSERYM